MDEGLDAFVKNGIGGIALLQAVTNALPIMFNTKDRQSRYLFMNRFQAELYGVTPEAAVGRTAAELLGASYGSYTRSIDQDVIQSGNASPFFEEAYAGVDGIMRHWLTCKVPWRDAAGDVAGVATTAFDISERKALEVALAQERDRAAQASRSRGFFLASMSHEIRTPLNGVLGMLELLGITEQTPQQRRYVAMATQAGRSLLGVVNQVLDLSRIDAGGMTLTQKPFAVAAMIDRAFATIAAAAQAKGLRLRWTTAAAVPEWLEGDSDRLGQVLVNLVGNAVRFTDAGVIAVAVSLARDDAAGVLLRFEVQDTGQGIPPAERARIFDAFVQADGARQPGHGGTGLGLAIARQICTAMDGEIGVEEAPGGGALFWFTARLKHRVMPAPVRRDATVRIEAKVLVAEDQPVNQLVTTGLLELLGCTVEVAADGALAVERWRNAAFDLVLMDCNMPEMDGYAATRALRAEETKLGRTRVPIIALTANGMADERAACLAAGMDDYLSKPCGKEALMDVIKRYVPRCVRERAA